jgi:hypothetical protein
MNINNEKNPTTAEEKKKPSCVVTGKRSPRHEPVDEENESDEF